MLQALDKGNAWIWLCAGVVSLALLTLVLLQVDFSVVEVMVRNLVWPVFLAAFLFLTLEGIFTALRIWLFAARKPCLSQALKANAWYVVLLVLLPARLGEVAAIAVFERYLRQSYGAAAMSIVVQRIYDVIILGVFFLVALIGLSEAFDKAFLYGACFMLIAIAVFGLYKMELFLTLAVLLFEGKKKGVLRSAKRFLLQARIWSRHIFKKNHIGIALITTALKWFCNLGALVCLFFAINLDLSFFEAVASSAAYNFLAIVPLQTIGGIGVGEAGLALILVATGMSTSVAASASILLRLAIIVFPFIFWAMVMGGCMSKKEC